MTIVFDRGMNSTNNIEQVLDKMHVVGALPSSMCKDLFQISLSEFEKEWENGKKNIEHLDEIITFFSRLNSNEILK